MEGPFKAWGALLNRFRNCRPGYHFISIDGESFLITAKGQSYKRFELSETLQKEMDIALKNFNE